MVVLFPDDNSIAKVDWESGQPGALDSQNRCMNHSQPWLDLLASAKPLVEKAAPLLLRTEFGLLLDETYAQYFILRRQLKNMAGVAGDIALLLEHERYENIIGLSRIVFEARISIAATLARPEYAAEKILAGIDESLKELDELLARDASGKSADARWLREERSRLEKIKRGYSEIRRRQWKVKEAAEVGGLLDAYSIRYPLLSHAAHSTPKGLSTKSDLRVVALCVVGLVGDLLDTIAALLFMEDAKSGKRGPAISNFKEVIPHFEILHQAYCDLHRVSDDLSKVLTLVE